MPDQKRALRARVLMQLAMNHVNEAERLIEYDEFASNNIIERIRLLWLQMHQLESEL